MALDKFPGLFKHSGEMRLLENTSFTIKFNNAPFFLTDFIHLNPLKIVFHCQILPASLEPP